MTVETTTTPHRKVSIPLIIGIVLFPVIFAWFTLRQGYSTLARVLAFGWALLALVVVFASQPGNPGATAPKASGDDAPAAVAEQPAQDPRYTSMSLDDLKLDKEQLVGQRVRVNGLYQAIGDSSLLASELLDSTPLWLDTSRLTREERKSLLDCDNRRCTFQVEGLVQSQALGIGISAERVVKQ